MNINLIFIKNFCYGISSNCRLFDLYEVDSKTQKERENKN